MRGSSSSVAHRVLFETTRLSCLVRRPGNGDVTLGTSFSKAAGTGRPHPLLCSAAFLFFVNLVLLTAFLFSPCCLVSVVAQISPSSDSFDQGPRIQDDSFWETMAQEPWEPVPDNPVREAVLQEALARCRSWQKLPDMKPEQRNANIVRALSGRHNTIYTDMPASPAVDELPQVLDLALDKILAWFQLDPAEYESWHVDVLFVRDPDHFKSWGGLAGLPGPTPGYSYGARIWVFDQHFDYYNRLLLIHELVHSVMNRSFGALAPRWFSEGIAEYLALHQWQNHELALAQIPSRNRETPGFARLDILNRLRYDKTMPDLTGIFALAPSDFSDSKAYALAWSLVLFLSNHERYRAVIEKMPYFMMAPDPTGQFQRMIGEANLPLAADWSDFILNFEPDYNFQTTLVDYTPGRSLKVGESVIISVSPQKGWQNSGLQLDPNAEYSLNPSGNFELYDPRQMVPCDANGITMTWHAGRPCGMLLFCPSNGSPNSSDFWRDAEPLRKEKSVTPSRKGTLFFRLNLPSSFMEKNQGSITVEIERAK